MDKNEKFVITLSREVGSGGHTVGRLLAERLKVHYYDKQIIEGLIERFNLTPEEIERIKGRKSNWFNDLITHIVVPPRPEMFIGHSPADVEMVVTPDGIFECERKLLLSLAEEASCVIAGRSGFFILEDHPNKFDIFITASREHRIKRVMSRQNLSREEAEKVIDKVDATRENFTKRYAKTSRYDLRNYDLVLNMDHLTEEAAAETILQLIENQSK